MASNDFTHREKQIMALAWQCFEGEPKVNFPKLAGLAGMTNQGSAVNAWAKIKKKLAAQAGEAGGAREGSESPVKRTPASGKRKKKADTPLEDGEGEGESPTKKTKVTPKANGGKKKKASEDAEDVPVKGEDEDEDIFN